ncbi:MAG TPA: NAD-dependent epimerase/dehydratase family protein, partial [Solirubrobacteraceae bacterium]|nr:NAD-dependent epimerase/dehydratase family protein [Solirubrobacteraceae bacterium]
MRILVTGATGYLGWRHVVLLRERGHEVTPLARPGHRPRTAARELDPVEHDRPESVTVIDKFRRLAAAGEPLTLD